MQFINPIYLIGEVVPTTNDAGVTKYQSSERKVFSNELSISQTEFYQAHSTDFKPELKFEIRLIEYKSEAKARYLEETYNIIRTYNNKKTGTIELTLSKGVNHATS